MSRAPLAYNCSLTRLDLCLTTKISLAPGLKCRVLQLLKIKFFFSFSFIHTRRFMDTLTVSAYRTISSIEVSRCCEHHTCDVCLVFMKFFSHSRFFLFHSLRCRSEHRCSRLMMTVHNKIEIKCKKYSLLNIFLQSERENGFD